MGKLQDILRANGAIDDLESAWTVGIAGEDDVLPRGRYVADITHGEAIESRSKGTPGYRLTFEIVEGEFKGRRLWHECWFTPKSLPRSRRDLKKLGVPVDESMDAMLAALDDGLPAVFRCDVKVVLRKDDDGTERNQIRRFDVVEVIERKPDDFAPESNTDEGDSDD